MANLTRWLYLLFFVNVVNFSVCLEKLEPLQCSAISAETLFLNTDDSYGYLTRNGSQTKNFSCSQLKKSSAKQTNLLNNRIISSHLFSHLPPIAPVQSPNPVCARQSQTYLDRLRNLDLWAVQMYDGSAKIPSGLLNGNVNQFGDFDLCMGAKQPDGEGIQGQYCLSYVELEVANSENKNLEHILNLMKSFSPFKSKLEDNYSRGQNSQWHTKIRNVFQRIHITTNISLKFIAVTQRLVTQCLMGFSLIKNTKKLISLDRSPDDIECVHGIRTLNAFMLLLSHKSMALFFNPYINRTQMASNLGKPWTVVARAASLYTDPFIMLSGLLTSYAFLRQFEKNKKINVMKEIVSRCFRLLPTLGALILFCTFILPFLGSGPQWNLVVSHHATICKQYWWRNMMFIHNYFGFKNMCLTHTHHVGIDTQLFFISPLLVYMVWRWPRNGLLALGFFSIVSTILRFIVTYKKQLSLFIYFGNP
ncbi:O-acyltransferase like protein-like [Diaphorina citri]|uniref:O-acyltransferase like protein-like n=1 Tax=Diaphorina citri TaxID=121845 RepID=A0A3Q0JJB3_DIACI|nr:O-acyltransferase like protein-like [Diaphorina citri]